MKVLDVSDLGKLYRLGQLGTGTISQDLNRWWAKVRGKEDPYSLVGQVNDRSKESKSDFVWALKDVNFSVNEGEVLGIIGRNGAGKSTLLKLISQITAPTTGSIKAKGRIASLLEVGTGMHPEMTARENIYLNGAILGMTKMEITKKFDEIVEFSGCAMYIDTPLKRFSSGMRVRLGFAVAAFLEPEILIVDEVLAVGDAEFQKKAIGKMKDISRSGGRTVLFVSHNMASVKSLCSRALIMENGTVVAEGDTDKMISRYLGGGKDVLNYRELNVNKNGFTISKIGVRSKSMDFIDSISREKVIELVIEFENSCPSDVLHFTIKLKGEDGSYFMSTNSANLIELPKGGNTAIMKFPEYFFNEGMFFLDVLVVENKKKAFLIEKDVLTFMVNPQIKSFGENMVKESGYIRTNQEWMIL